ncbi:MAG: hypothetical protein P4L84_22265 [Isosphaeraceae bacterium]|nr:hypothetical protein [Isosphaeraceae bacterium]
MSMRPLIYPITSLDPIRRALGSRDTSLLEPLVASFKQLRGDRPDAIPEFRERAESFLAGELRDGQERGEWEYSIYFAAHALGLLQSDLPINDDWAWGAWGEYFDEVADRLPADAQELLCRLVDGRGLKTESVDCPGAYYAWLGPEEVERLLAALDELEAAHPDVADAVEGFHENLTDWLNQCRGKTCLLLAS